MSEGPSKRQACVTLVIPTATSRSLEALSMYHRHPRLLNIPGVFVLRITHMQLSVLNTEPLGQDVVSASLVSFKVRGQSPGALTQSSSSRRH